MYLHGTSHVNDRGHLEIGGCDTVHLAKDFGTPLFIYDETLIREQCRAYVQAFQKSGFQFQVAYAGKAFSSLKIFQLVKEEGLSLDVVSGGELYIALQAGFPVERIHFHGNNKSKDELELALDANIGCFVVDNFFELSLLQSLAEERKQTVQILLRVTPGVEAHTHDYISTGQEDSKFGFDVSSGQAREAVRISLEQSYVELLGLHSHIGSQIFDTTGFEAAAKRLADFLQTLRSDLDYTASVLNLGGGFGIRYNQDDTPLPKKDYVDAMTRMVHDVFQEKSYPLPELWIEPGRSIVGEAGTTLYTIGSLKQLEGIRKYVSVDGGMTDNLRPALYQANYEAMLANRADEDHRETVSVAGKCCESGDMLIWDMSLPVVDSGDLLAVSCTGAYGYAMANNYNRIPRPAVVFVKDGQAELTIERETYADLMAKERM